MRTGKAERVHLTLIPRENHVVVLVDRRAVGRRDRIRDLTVVGRPYTTLRVESSGAGVSRGSGTVSVTCAESSERVTSVRIIILPLYVERVVQALFMLRSVVPFWVDSTETPEGRISPTDAIRHHFRGP